MKRALLLVAFGSLFLACHTPVHSQSSREMAGKISFRLNNVIDHPAYQWPLTMLNYPVQFPDQSAHPESLTLVNHRNDAVPFQLTDRVVENGWLKSGRIYFLTDLPHGQSREFHLLYSKQKTSSTLPASDHQVIVKNHSQGLEIRNNRTSILIPSVGTKSSAEVTGPILSIGKVNPEGTVAFHGTSSIHIPSRSLQSWRVIEMERGELVARYKVEYTFEDDAMYAVIILAEAGMPYINLIEEGSSIGHSEDQYWELDLGSMKPTHRLNHYAGDKKDERTRWELIDADLHPETGEFPHRLAPFHPKDNRYRHQLIGFRNEQDFFGLFTRLNETWENDRYPLWSSDRFMGAFFFFKNNRLLCRFPVTNGRQWIGITAYPEADGYQPLVSMAAWYSILDLNKVKDHVYEWDELPGNHSHVFEPLTNVFTSGTAYQDGIEKLWNGNYGFTGFTSNAFTNGGDAKNPSTADRQLKKIMPQLEWGLSRMTPDELRKAKATAALMAYLHAEDSYYPDKILLAGHPNFMGDAKTPPGLYASIFPGHPQADYWRDRTERTMELLLRYHTRPTVESWQSKGGRWTENPSCYLLHCLKGWSDAFAAMLCHGDHRNIWAKPHADELGSYMVNLLTAPYQNKRCIPQQGAHSPNILTPDESYLALALGLKNYAPLLAENLVWANRSNSTSEIRNIAGVTGTREPLAAMRKGTQPSLKSEKFTGYGLVMRHAFGKPEEVYVHLQQIDAGPNYRWGRAGDGGNGIIYFYANGRRYSAHGTEHVGDASNTDTEYCSNFGVWRNQSSGISRFKAKNQREPDRQDQEGMFYGIGLNDLTEPFYSFEISQFARVLANPEYAGPDYHSRSVVLVGGDYFIVHDALNNPEAEGRFSWFTGGEDELPIIQQLAPGAKPVERIAFPDKKTKTPGPKGVYFTGKGSFKTLVTHKPGYEATATEYGVIVEHEKGTDHVFLAPVIGNVSQEISHKTETFSFKGTAGVMRVNQQALQQFSLFGEGELEVAGLKLKTIGDSGISGSLINENEWSGEAFSQIGNRVIVHGAEGKRVFVDGIPVGSEILLSPGRHIWQILEGLPIPPQPEIQRSIYGPMSAEILWNTIPGATHYVVEISQDDEQSWRVLGDHVEPTDFLIESSTPGKIHVRVTAVNPIHKSTPSQSYPLYIGNDPSPAPHGLKINLYNGGIRWGSVFGAGTYQLLKRHKDHESEWTVVYEGPETNFEDWEVKSEKRIEYAIAAFNRNGGTTNSIVKNNDPTAYLNIDPNPTERFRRQVETFESYGEGAYDHWRESYQPILPPYPR